MNLSNVCRSIKQEEASSLQMRVIEAPSERLYSPHLSQGRLSVDLSTFFFPSFWLFRKHTNRENRFTQEAWWLDVGNKWWTFPLITMKNSENLLD